MYIDKDTYRKYLGDSPEVVKVVTEVRIRRASRLLDYRIGNHERKDNYKLDLDELSEYQRESVEMWVCYMVKALFDNNDSVQVNQTIRLGRFQATQQQGNTVIPDGLKYADMQLKDSGMIRRDVKIQRRTTNDGYYLD